MRTPEQQAKLEALRRDVQKGVDSADAGRRSPKDETMAELRAKRPDAPVETEIEILATPSDPEFLRVMETEARISKKYPNALRELAGRRSDDST